MIFGRGVIADPRKVAAVGNCARPSSFIYIRLFLGLANYYRQLVRQFSLLAAPLKSLRSHLATVRWSDTRTSELRGTKSGTCVRLGPSGVGSPDPSELAVSGILEQPDPSGAFRPMPTSPANSQTRSEHCQPICWSLWLLFVASNLRPYLLDHSFELCTDNASLQCFFTETVIKSPSSSLT